MALPLAVQLYSVREALTADYDGVIRQIADMGYAGVELAGMYGEGVEQAARLFSQLGLRVPSAHLPLPLGDDKNRVLDTAAAFGLQYIVLAWLPPDGLRAVDQIKAHCERINEANVNARAQGLTLCYHNHWWEVELIEALGDRTPLDVMLNHLDPSVGFEIDLYWVKAGGADPVLTLKRLGARVPLIHIKDGSTKVDDPMTAVGQGIVDYTGVLPAAAHADWGVVELDRCATDMLTAIGESYTYLTGAGLGRGR